LSILYNFLIIKLDIYFGETGHFYFGVTDEFRIRVFMLNEFSLRTCRCMAPSA